LLRHFPEKSHYHTSTAASLKSGQSNQKRNKRVHRRVRKERREKKSNNLCVLSDLCGKMLEMASDFIKFHMREIEN
jgi:hypothetical protein